MRWAVALALAIASIGFARSARSAQSVDGVEVWVPEAENLQFLVFWVAMGARLFDAEELDVKVQVPNAPRDLVETLRSGKASIAVLPPPMCLELIETRTPIVLVANLLANDPINLIVNRDVAQKRNLSKEKPLRDRLLGLHGLRIGVAPNPPVRLRALFASAGLDADREIEMVIVGGHQQNRAFEQGDVDALYAHTPFLETALVDQGAVLLVNQSAGEVAELANRQIHALVVTRRFTSEHRRVVVRLVRALARAAKLVRDDPASAVRALLQRFPDLDSKKVDAVTRLYQPAVPKTLRVSADELQRSAALFPAARSKPRLEGIDLNAHVDNQFVDEVETSTMSAITPPRAPKWRTIAVFTALAVTVLSLLAIYRRRLTKLD